MLSRPMFDRIAFFGISWYSLLIVAGILIGLAFCSRESRRYRISQDALLDRIRALEEKIESGAIAVNMTAPSNVTYESVQSTPIVKKTLDRAVPEDVKQVIRQWAAIRNDLPLPMKSYLKTAKLSLAGDDRLQIVLEDGLSSDYFLKQEGHKEFLQDKISEAVDKQISIDIQCVKDDREFDAKYVDLTAIQFDIDEIDDDAEEFI